MEGRLDVRSYSPLEALRLLLSDLATKQRGPGRHKGRRKLLLIDVCKAHLHAFVDREVYVDLPPEVAEPGKCARLVRCLYGTRDAPSRWEALYTQTLEAMGFTRGKASACCFYHSGWGLRCVVHGDDFAFTGTDEALAWVQKKMEEAFLCKVGGSSGVIQGTFRSFAS